MAETGNSRYRDALDEYGHDPDALYDYLQKNRLADPSLALGYYLMRAEKLMNRNQSDIADEAGVSRAFISAILSGRTRSTPQTYTRIARAVGANPLEFLIAEGFIDAADVAAYQMPGAREWQQMGEMLVGLDEADRHNTVAMVRAIVKTVLAERESRQGRKLSVPSIEEDEAPTKRGRKTTTNGR